MNLVPQECRAVVELIHAVDTVFDADPTIKADTRKLRKDRVIIVDTLTDDAMAESVGIAFDVFFTAQIFDGTLSQIAIAGVHGDHAMLDVLEQLERIVAGQSAARAAGQIGSSRCSFGSPAAPSAPGDPTPPA